MKHTFIPTIMASSIAIATYSAVLQAETLAGDKKSGDNLIEEIVVHGDKSVPFKSFVISPKVINQPDTGAAMKALPGANLNSNGPVTGIVQYRGLFGDRVAVTMENEAVLGGGPNAMDTPLSYAPALLLKELKLSRGIASVSKSQESIGGHVSASLDRGQFSDTGEAELSGGITSRYGTVDDGASHAVKVVGANDQHKVAVLASFDEGDDAESGDGKTLSKTAYRRARYDLSYAWQNAISSAEFSLGKLDTENTGTPSLPMDIRYIDADIANFNGSFIYQGLIFRTRMGYRHVDHLMDNFSLRSNGKPMAYRQNHATGVQFTLGANVELALGEDSLVVGVDSAETRHSALITNPNMAMFRVDNFANAERDIYGLFTEWKGSRGLWDLEAGLRYNRVETGSDEVGGAVMPGMQANVDALALQFNNAERAQNFDNIDVVLKASRPLNESVDFNVGLGRKTRAPSYQELYLWMPLEATGGLADGRTYIGNLDLDSEVNHEMTLGLDWAEGDLHASAQVFYRKVDDFIQGTPSSNMTANMLSTMMSGQAPLQFNNIDAELYGFDGRYGMGLNDYWQLNGVVSYVRGRDTDQDDNLYRVAPLNNRLTLTWQEDKLSGSLESVLYAPQTDTSSYNDEERTSGYGLLNFYGQYDVLENVSINTGVENILDKNYVDHLTGYNRNGDSDIPVGDRLPGRGRNLFVSVSMGF